MVFPFAPFYMSPGIGPTTTMFSVIKRPAFAGLPFDNPDQLVSPTKLKGRDLRMAFPDRAPRLS